MRSRVIITSDGKRGHENQSHVLARMLGDKEPLVMRLRPRIAEWPLRLRIALTGLNWLSTQHAEHLVKRRLVPDSPTAFRQFAEEHAEAQCGTRYFTVSAGTQPATYNLVISRLLKATPLVIMTPSMLNRSFFALNIVPEHDLPPGSHLPENVIPSKLALSFHDEVSASSLASMLLAQSGIKRGKNYLAVALGGPSRNTPWIKSQVIRSLKDILGFAERESYQILITTSRRSPLWCTAWLEEHYARNPAVAYYLDASRNPLNPLPAFYELCRVIAVSDDSYSMVCEAVQAGHRPLLINCSQPGPASASERLKSKDKVQRSLATLQAGGLIADWPLRERDAVDQLALHQRAAPNQEYQRLSAIVRRQLDIE